MLDHIDSLKKIVLLSLIVGVRETPETIKNAYESVKVMNSVMAENDVKPPPEEEIMVYMDILQGQQPTNE